MSEWIGYSRKRYKFEDIAITGYGDGSNPWPRRAAVYKFSRLENGRYHAIYIGQTDNVADRFAHHEKISCIQENGATHIHLWYNTMYATRITVETDLVHVNNPRCNS